MKLIKPTLALHQAFELFYDDFLKHDAVNMSHYGYGIDDFPTYIRALNRQANGISTPSSFGKSHHFWLVDDKESILIGTTQVRQDISQPFLYEEGGQIGYLIAPSLRRKGFGTLILRLTLYKAKLLGYTQLLVTAKKENIASRRII